SDETRLPRIPIGLLQRLAKRPRMDRSMGQRLGLLPALRQRKDFLLPQQQSAGGFLLHVMQRGIRTQESKGKIRNAGCGWHFQDEVRASRSKQQSESIPDELRSQVACG